MCWRSVVAYRILIAVSYLLLHHEPYRAPGVPASDEQQQEQLLKVMRFLR